MSDIYDNTNTGALFKNENRESDRHPHYSGTAEINVGGGPNQMFSIAGWVNEASGRGQLPEGTKYLSLKFTPKDSTQPRPESRADEDLDDLF